MTGPSLPLEREVCFVPLRNKSVLDNSFLKGEDCVPERPKGWIPGLEAISPVCQQAGHVSLRDLPE